MNCVQPSRHHQAGLEFDCGSIILVLEIDYLQTNPANAAIQSEVRRSVVNMPGLLQVIPILHHVSAVAGAHQLLSVFREHPM